MGRKRRHILLFIFILAHGLPADRPGPLFASAPDAQPTGSDGIRIQSLKSSDPILLELRKEIARNLISTRRGKGLVVPLRFREYRVKKGDNFYTIMARVSLNPRAESRT